MSEQAARIARNANLADRLIESVVNRAGSEDTAILIAEFIDSFESDEDKIFELMYLTLTVVERAADYSTPVDIWDPHRRIDSAKAIRLGRQTLEAFGALGEELNSEKGNDHG